MSLPPFANGSAGVPRTASSPNATSAVMVAIRIRPEEDDREAQQQSIVVRNNTLVFGSLTASFDYIFSSTANQDYVFANAIAPLLEQSKVGFNCTIFAYGQTGSGKTYTMGLNKEHLGDGREGIIPRCAASIFEAVPSSSKDHHFVVSFVEIYNEVLRDLLVDHGKPTQQLQIAEEAWKGTVVRGIKEVVVKSPMDLFVQLKKGIQNRTTRETAMNEESSRSHAIFTIAMTRPIPTSAAKSEVIYSKLHLVDLAGSERAKKSLSEGSTLKETGKINYGLFALSNVINSLADNTKNATERVPYRDSKLTHLLKDSLGGNSKTLMIACVRSSKKYFEETASTLTYAARVRQIRNIPRIIRDPLIAVVDQLRSEISILRSLVNVDCGVSVDMRDAEVSSLVQAGNIPRALQLLQTKCDNLEQERQKLWDENNRLKQESMPLSPQQRDKQQHQIQQSSPSRNSNETNLIATENASRDNSLIDKINNNNDNNMNDNERLGAVSSSDDDDDGTTSSEDMDNINDELVANINEQRIQDDQYLVQKAILLQQFMESKMELRQLRNDRDKIATEHQRSRVKNAKDMQRMIKQVDSLKAAGGTILQNKQAEIDALKARIAKIAEDLQDARMKAADRDKLAWSSRIAETKMATLAAEVAKLKEAKHALLSESKEEKKKYREEINQLKIEMKKLKNTQDRNKIAMKALEQGQMMDPAVFNRAAGGTPRIQPPIYTARSASVSKKSLSTHRSIASDIPVNPYQLAVASAKMNEEQFKSFLSSLDEMVGEQNPGRTTKRSVTSLAKKVPYNNSVGRRSTSSFDYHNSSSIGSSSPERPSAVVHAWTPSVPSLPITRTSTTTPSRDNNPPLPTKKPRQPSASSSSTSTTNKLGPSSSSPEAEAITAEEALLRAEELKERLMKGIVSRSVKPEQIRQIQMEIKNLLSIAQKKHFLNQGQVMVNNNAAKLTVHPLAAAAASPLPPVPKKVLNYEEAAPVPMPTLKQPNHQAKVAETLHHQQQQQSASNPPRQVKRGLGLRDFILKDGHDGGAAAGDMFSAFFNGPEGDGGYFGQK